MNYLRKIFIFSFFIFLILAGAAQSQEYAIPWWTVEGGGGTSAGGSYNLSGAIGQFDAGLLSGGSYRLTGGFWGMELSRMVYLPLILKN